MSEGTQVLPPLRPPPAKLIDVTVQYCFEYG